MPVGKSIEETLAGLQERMGLRRAVRVFESLSGRDADVGRLAGSGDFPAGKRPLRSARRCNCGRSLRTNWLMSAGTTISSMCCKPSSRPSCFIIRPSGGFRVDPTGTRAVLRRRSHWTVRRSPRLRPALASLEEQRAAAPGWAIAARGGALSARIRRVVGLPEQVQTDRLSLLLVAAAMILILANIGRTGGALPPALPRPTGFNRPRLFPTAAGQP